MIPQYLDNLKLSKDSDFYLFESNCLDRLISEWKLHKSLIVAYDYDNTVFDYSNKNNSCKLVIELLRECKKEGFHLIVFTSCNSDRFPEIEKYLRDNDIPYNAINEDSGKVSFNGRKIYYNHLLDDRAGLPSAYRILKNLINTIRGYKANSNLDEMG